MIFGIIFLTAVVVHIFCTGWYCGPSKTCHRQFTALLQIITQNKLFHRLAFTLQGLSSIFRRYSGYKGTEAADILTTCAQLWIMMYALLSVFSLLDVILNLAQKFGGISVTAERDFQGLN